MLNQPDFVGSVGVGGHVVGVLRHPVEVVLVIIVVVVVEVVVDVGHDVEGQQHQGHEVEAVEAQVAVTACGNRNH